MMTVQVKFNTSVAEEKFVRKYPLKSVTITSLILAIILSPSIRLWGGFYEPALADFILLPIAIVWIFFFITGNKGSLHPPNYSGVVLRILGGMFYVAIVSICVGTIVFDQTLIINDFMILPMIARYCLIYLVGKWIQERYCLRVFVWALLLGVTLSALIGVLQHFNLLGVNDWLTPYFLSKDSTLFDLELLRLHLPGARVVGTHGDPRHYSYILVVGIGLCFSIFLTRQAKLLRKVALMSLCLCSASLMFTASRTGALSGLVILFAALLVQRGKAVNIKWLIFPIFLVGMLALSSPVFETSTFQNRVLTVHSESFDTSWQARVRDFSAPFHYALESPIIWLTGRGPSKAGMRTDSHNEFGWYFYRFGLPGLFLYILLIYRGFRISWRAIRNSVGTLEKSICISASLLTINWFIFAMAENIFKDPKLMALNMLLLGASVGASASVVKSEKGRP